MQVELAILSLMFQYPNLIMASQITPEMFKNASTREYFEYLIGVMQRELPLLSDDLESKFPNLHKAIRDRGADIAEYENYYAYLQSDYMSSIMGRVAGQIGDIAQSELSPLDKQNRFVESFISALSVISKSRFGRTDDAQRLIERFNQYEAQGIVYRAVTTGVRVLDDNVAIKEGDLIVFGARPGVGKTTLASNIVLHASGHGKKCLYITSEMTVMDMMARFARMMAGVNPTSKLLKKQKL